MTLAAVLERLEAIREAPIGDAADLVDELIIDVGLELTRSVPVELGRDPGRAQSSGLAWPASPPRPPRKPRAGP